MARDVVIRGERVILGVVPWLALEDALCLDMSLRIGFHCARPMR